MPCYTEKASRRKLIASFNQGLAKPTYETVLLGTINTYASDHTHQQAEVSEMLGARPAFQKRASCVDAAVGPFSIEEYVSFPDLVCRLLFNYFSTVVQQRLLLPLESICSNVSFLLPTVNS